MTRANAGSRRHRILIVDDDPLFVELMKAVLQRECAHWELMTAFDGEAALRIISASTTRPSIVFCDINMPKRDGVELLEDLARIVPNLPVVLVSGAGSAILRSTEALATANGLNVLGAFRKPLDFDTFGAFVRSIAATL